LTKVAVPDKKNYDKSLSERKHDMDC
jgi:hypothetical protein